MTKFIQSVYDTLHVSQSIQINVVSKIASKDFEKLFQKKKAFKQTKVNKSYEITNFKARVCNV